jgi:hypothetical protein
MNESTCSCNSVGRLVKGNVVSCGLCEGRSSRLHWSSGDGLLWSKTASEEAFVEVGFFDDLSRTALAHRSSAKACRPVPSFRCLFRSNILSSWICKESHVGSSSLGLEVPLLDDPLAYISSLNRVKLWRSTVRIMVCTERQPSWFPLSFKVVSGRERGDER